MAPVKQTRQSRGAGNAGAATSPGNNTSSTQKASGHSTRKGGIKEKRVVKNKAKDLATKGTVPWSDQLRQSLLDLRVAHSDYNKVCAVLNRSNQSARSEFNKMLLGLRNRDGQVDWQQKALACNQQRTVNFPKKQTGSSRITTTTNPSLQQERPITTIVPLGNIIIPINSTTRTAESSTVSPTSTMPVDSPVTATGMATTPESSTLSPTSTTPADSPLMPIEKHQPGSIKGYVSLGHSNPTTSSERMYFDTPGVAARSYMSGVSYVRGDSSQSARDAGPRRMAMLVQQYVGDEEDDIAYKQEYECFVTPPKKRALKPTDFHPTDYWVYERTIEEEPECKTRPSNYFFQQEGYHRDEDGTLFYNSPYGFSRPCLPEGSHRKEHVGLRPLKKSERDADFLAGAPG